MAPAPTPPEPPSAEFWAAISAAVAGGIAALWKIWREWKEKQGKAKPEGKVIPVASRVHPALPLEIPPEMPSDLRVLLADDHAIFTRALRLQLSSLGVAVVGEAHTGEAAVEMAASLKPHVVLMDLGFKHGISGVEATRRIKQAAPEVRVVGLSGSEDPEQVMELAQAGGVGYIVKDRAMSDLVAALRRMLEEK